MKQPLIPQIKGYIWLLVLLANLANIADIITTIIAVNMGYTESKALPKFLLSLGIFFFIICKSLVIFYFSFPFKYGPMGLFFVMKKYGLFYKFIAIALLSLMIIYFGKLAIGNFLIILG